MARAAEEHLGKPVAFELSIANVDKPELGPEEVRRRLDQFAGRAEVWVTRGPAFWTRPAFSPERHSSSASIRPSGSSTPAITITTKKECFEALRSFAEQGCRFLVACRVDGVGRCVTRADVGVPAGFEDLFEALPAERFRWDISSSQLRERQT